MKNTKKKQAPKLCILTEVEIFYICIHVTYFLHSNYIHLFLYLRWREKKAIEID